MADPTDAELVARAAAGSEHAFRLLYRAYATAVYRIAWAVLRDAVDAEDVTQETFVTAWGKLRGFRLEGASALPWLATICRNHAANRVRARRRDAHEPVDDTLPAPLSIEQTVIDAELARRIAAEVERLDALDREVFVLCVSEGYAYQAAADALGVSHAAVRNRLSRIRSRLRTVVKETS
jgi:RNA polymerase sigma factor (sigma-70 family)